MAIRAEGRVSRLFVEENEFLFWLDIPQDQLPGRGDSYFTFDTTRPNYNAMVSMLLAAAVNRYQVLVRTAEDIDTTKGPDRNARVRYVLVDW